MSLSHCRIDPLVSVVRFYKEQIDDECDISMMSTYDCIGSLFIYGERAVITGVCGEFSAKYYLALKDKLKAKGIKRVSWERHKRGSIDIKERII